MPMRHASRWIRAAGPALSLAALSLAVPLLAGCAAGGTAQSGSSTSPSTSPGLENTTPPPGPTGSVPPNPPGGSAMSRVVVTRTGGIAGVSQSLRVDPNGSWIYVDRRPVAQKTGRLAEPELRQLASLVTGSAFARESRMPPPVGTCNDGFIYVITVGELTSRYDDCATQGDRPTTAAVIDLLVDATPL
jgi:hypothetical protein